SRGVKGGGGGVHRVSGAIIFEGKPIQGLRSHAIAARGLQLVPEDRRIFGSLSVEETLVLAGLTAKSRWPLARVWETFPRLQERRGSRGTGLSRGEEQKLARAPALVREPQNILPYEAVAG